MEAKTARDIFLIVTSVYEKRRMPQRVSVARHPRSQTAESRFSFVNEEKYGSDSTCSAARQCSKTDLAFA
jgi:hypothetical protein